MSTEYSSPKVSLVMPCYNGVSYISGMFDSILAQKYDNIELILVNDGSTDETPAVIGSYMERFISRGFSVTVIDQENQGVGNAVRNGLLRATGDFISFIDCDDALDTEYVSTLAGYLNEHEDCEMVGSRSNANFINGDKPRHFFEEKLLDALILERVYMSVVIYMFRMSLIKRVKLAEKFCTNARVCQEPDIIIPLTYNARKIAYIDRSLYVVNINQSGITQTRLNNQEKGRHYCSDRGALIYRAIVAYNLPVKYLLYYNILYAKQKLGVFPELEDTQFYDLKIYATALGYNDLAENATDFKSLYNNLTDAILGVKYFIKPSFLESITGKLIFYGVLGVQYKSYAYIFRKAGIHPDIMFDVKEGETLSVSPEDTIVVFPKSREILKTVREKYSCRVFSLYDIIETKQEGKINVI